MTAKTKSFIHEFQLKLKPGQERFLLVRLDCAKQLYNTCLGESLRRLKSMRESRDFKKALNLGKGKQRTSAFNALNELFGFREFDLHAYATAVRNSCHIGVHLNSDACQKTASRAFKAVKEYSVGKRGRPRFKGMGQYDSIEGKGNRCIIWDGEAVICDGERIDVIFDPVDKYGVQAHALACPVKYVRIVRRKIRGRNRFVVQLVLRGKPKFKYITGSGIMGLDLGPSTIAAVSRKMAFLEKFCADLDPMHKEIRRIQRSMDRSMHAMNPDAYNENGTIKPGVKLAKSKRYIKKSGRIREIHRTLAAQRKCMHGKLANRIFQNCKRIVVEKVSYLSWQRNFGRSVNFRAPGMFVEMLRRKAESAGGKIFEVPTALRPSQTCHGCEKIKKKHLSQRWHDCECGIHVQRDIMSAFLAMTLKIGKGRDGNTYRLDYDYTRKVWSGVESLLKHAVIKT